MMTGGSGGIGAKSVTALANLSVHFDGLCALENVDLSVRQGEIVGLIGPNGAGKTTFINALTGFQLPSAGSVHLGDVDITRGLHTESGGLE